MSRLCAALLLLTLLALSSTHVSAAAAILDRPTFTCSAGAATTRFSWRPAFDATVQYIDVSLADNGFSPAPISAPGPSTPTSHLTSGRASGPTYATTTAPPR
jgi:hypothetical protein